MKWIMAVALLVRIGAQFAVGTPPINSDAGEYVALAHNIRFRGTFSFGAPHRWGDEGQINPSGPFTPTAARAPLYPAFIAFFWRGSTVPAWPVRITQVLLGTLTVLLVFLIARPELGRSAAFLAASICAIAPASVFATAEFMSETLFTFLLTLGVWLWGKQNPIPAGITLGLAAMTRSVAFPVLVAIGLIAIIVQSRRKQYGVIAIVGLSTLAPWSARNLQATGEVVPIAVQGWGSNLLFGTIARPWGAGNPWPAFASDAGVSAIIAHSATESEAERKMFDDAVARIRIHPLSWLWTRLRQYPRLFVESGSVIRGLLPPTFGEFIRRSFQIGSVVLCLLCVAGVFTARKYWSALEPVLVIPSLILLFQLPMLADPRYTTPILPEMAILSAITLRHLRNGRHLTFRGLHQL